MIVKRCIMRKYAAGTAVLMLLVSLGGYQESFAKRKKIYDEEKAVKEIADVILKKEHLLGKKKCAVFDFTSLDGRKIPEGVRLSKKLMEELLEEGGLKLVERTEIDKILDAQGIEQTGIVNSEYIRESGNVLPVDVMISGTIAQVSGHGELTVKAVDINTGEIYAVSTVDFTPDGGFTYRENNKRLEMHQKDPGINESINRAFALLDYLNKKHPVVYLITVIDDNDKENIRRNHRELGINMKRTARLIKKRHPVKWKETMALRNGVSAIRKHDPEKYQILMKWKRELIARPPR